MGRRVAPLFLPALHPVLELSLDLVERSVRRLARVVDGAFLRRSMADEDLVPGKVEVHRDAEPLSTALMVTVPFDHDVAGNDAVEQALHLLGAIVDVGRERIGVRDAPERELKWCLHLGRCLALGPRKIHAWTSAITTPLSSHPGR